jgi:hypothetical protein
MKPILKSYLVEINLGTTVPGNGTNIPFQDYPQLRDIYLTGVTTSDSNTVAVSPAGKNVVTDLTGISITFIDKFNMEIIRGYASKELNPYYQFGFYRDFNPFQLQLTKSYITILDNTNLLAAQSLIVNIFYIDAKDVNKARTKTQTRTR